MVMAARRPEDDSPCGHSTEAGLKLPHMSINRIPDIRACSHALKIDLEWSFHEIVVVARCSEARISLTWLKRSRLRDERNWASRHVSSTSPGPIQAGGAQSTPKPIHHRGRRCRRGHEEISYAGYRFPP